MSAEKTISKQLTTIEIRAQNARTVDDLMPLAKMLWGKRRVSSPPLLKGVRGGRVEGIFVCTVPIRNKNLLVFKGPDAQVASLFGDLSLGGVVSKSTIAAFLDTPNQEDVDLHVGNVAKALQVTCAAAIHETEDRTGFSIQFFRSSDLDADLSDLPRCLAKDAFMGIESDLRTVVIVSRYELLGEAALREDAIAEDYRRARETAKDISALNAHVPKIKESGHEKGKYIYKNGRWYRR